jgi:hypothetical protein
MKVSEVTGGDLLKAADLGDAEVPVVIAEVSLKEFKNDAGGTDKKFLITFQNKKKGLVANKTNSKRIAKMYGEDTDDWIGKEIVLYVDHEVTFGSDMVSAIRVRGPQKITSGPQEVPF